MAFLASFVVALSGFLPEFLTNILVCMMTLLDTGLAFIWTLNGLSVVLSILTCFPALCLYMFILYTCRHTIREFYVNNQNHLLSVQTVKNAFAELRSRRNLKARYIRKMFNIHNTPRSHSPDQFFFSHQEITALTGCLPSTEAWFDLHGKIWEQIPSFPGVPKDSVRTVRGWLRQYKFLQPTESSKSVVSHPLDYISTYTYVQVLFVLCVYLLSVSLFPSGTAIVMCVCASGIMHFVRVCFKNCFGWVSEWTPRGILSAGSQVVLETVFPPGSLLDYRTLDLVGKRLRENPIGTGAVLMQFTRAKSMSDYIFCVVTLSSMLGLELALRDAIIQRLFSFNNDVLIEQGPDSKKLLFLVAFLGSALGFNLDLLSTKTLDNVVKMGSASGQMEKVWDYLEETLCELGVIETATYKRVGELMKAIEVLVPTLSECESNFRSRPVTYCYPNVYKDWTIFRNKIEELEVEFAKEKFKPFINTNMLPEITSLSNRARKLDHEITLWRNSSGFRPTPVGIMLEGPSQIGKSHVMEHLTDLVKQEMARRYASKTEDNFSRIASQFSTVNQWQTWNQNYRDEYDQGYGGQEIHSIDDIFTPKDQSDHPALLTFISCNRIPTKQAALGDKGKPYESRIVIGSCNNPPVSSVTVTNLDALYNRFPIWMTVTQKPGKKVPSGRVFDSSFSWLQFDLCTGRTRYTGNTDSENERCEDITLAEVVKKICERLEISAHIYADRLEAFAPVETLNRVVDVEQFEEQAPGVPVMPVNQCVECRAHRIRLDAPSESSLMIARSLRDLSWRTHMIEDHKRVVFNTMLCDYTEFGLIPVQRVESVFKSVFDCMSVQCDPTRMKSSTKEFFEEQSQKLKASTSNSIYPYLTSFANFSSSMYSRVVVVLTGMFGLNYSGFLNSMGYQFNNLIAFFKSNLMFSALLLVLTLLLICFICVLNGRSAQECSVGSTAISLANQSVQSLGDVQPSPFPNILEVHIVTGAGLSSIGKGSLAEALIEQGPSTIAIKIDPYLNRQASDFNPAEHGECFILPDGAAVDLDLGRYLRAGAYVDSSSSITGGKVLERLPRRSETSITDKTRTDIVSAMLNEALAKFPAAKRVVIEVGGTIAETENAYIYPALALLSSQYKTYVHCVAPALRTVHGEPKFRFSHVAYDECVSKGLTPSAMYVVSEEGLLGPRAYGSAFAVGVQYGPSAWRYAVREVLAKYNLPTRIILRKETSSVKKFIILSKYPSRESHESILAHIKALGDKNSFSPDVSILTSIKEEDLKGVSGVVVAGGYGSSGVAELIDGIQLCAVKGIPTLAICFGHQLAYVALEDYYSAETGFGKVSNTEIFFHHQTKGLVGDNIYRHSYSVPYKGLLGEENCVKPRNGKQIVARRKWSENFISTQYHPEFSASLPAPDFLHLIEPPLTQQWWYSPPRPVLTSQTVPGVYDMKGDLFSFCKDMPIAHCIDATAKMGKGIAVDVAKRFPKPSPSSRFCAKRTINDAGEVCYHLITKYFHFDKPTYESLSQALCGLALMLKRDRVSRIAIPRLGCGLDRLDWAKVRPLIERTLKDTVVFAVEFEEVESQATVGRAPNGVNLWVLGRNWQKTASSDGHPLKKYVKEYPGGLYECENGVFMCEDLNFVCNISSYYSLIPSNVPINFMFCPLASVKDWGITIIEYATQYWGSNAVHLDPQSPVYNFNVAASVVQSDSQNGTVTKIAVPLRGNEVQHLDWLAGMFGNKQPEILEPVAIDSQASMKDFIVTRLAKDLPAKPRVGPLTCSDADITSPILAEQGYDSQSAQSVLAHVVANYAVGCGRLDEVAEAPHTTRGFLNGIAFGNHVILPAHFVSERAGNQWVRVCKYQQLSAVKQFAPQYTVARLVSRNTEWDLAVCEMVTTSNAKRLLQDVPMNVQNDVNFVVGHPYPMGVVKHFIKNSDLQAANCMTKGLQHVPTTNIVFPVQWQYANPQTFSLATGVVTRHYMAVRHASTSATFTNAGDCGGVVVSAESRMIRRLIGFHTGISRSGSYCALITQERLESLLNPITEQGPAIEAVPFYSASNPFAPFFNPHKEPLILPSGPLKEFVGISINAHFSTPSSHGDLVKTPFYGVFEPLSEPCVLDPNTDPRVTDTSHLETNARGQLSIVQSQISEYSRDTSKVDDNLLEECFKELEDHFCQVLYQQQQPVNAPKDRQMFYYEAFNGNPNLPCYEPMELRSSAGNPWGWLGWQTKSDFVERAGGDVWFAGEAGRVLYGHCERFIESAQQGEVLPSIYTDKVKVELKGPKNISIGKSRTFTCTPIEDVLLVRATCGRFKSAVTAAGLKLQHGVGVNPLSRDWHAIGEYLERNTVFFDADFKNFDRCIPPQVMERALQAIRNIILRLHPDDPYDMIREALFKNYVNSYMLSDSTLWRSFKGNKSGHVLTTILNNLVNFFYHLYCWKRIMSKNNLESLTSLQCFLMNCSLVTFGDDVVRSVSRKFSDLHSFAAYKDVLETELGQTYTPASKDVTKVALGSLSEVTFLKRSFVKGEAGFYKAPLDIQSICQCWNYSEIPEGAVLTWKALAMECMVEAANVGRTFFQQFSKKLLKHVLDPDFVRNNSLLSETLVPVFNLPFNAVKGEVLSRYGYGTSLW